MKVEIHILSHDDEAFLEWSLRHYRTIASRLVVWDGGPKWTNRPVLGGVEYRPWDTAGELNDDLARKLKNECWRGTDADWVIVADADELLHFPQGLERTLARYAEIGAAVPRPRGFEMFSDAWFPPEDNPGWQITELCKDGAPDDKWYAKPILFSPKLVAESRFGLGAHESRPVLKDGRTLNVDGKWPFADPPVNLLHYKSIFGGLGRIAERYDATRKRLCAQNVRNNWGNVHDSGVVHATKKRDALLPLVRRVVA